LFVKDGNETAKPERSIAHVASIADAEFLPPVTEFVRQTARRSGLQDKAAEHLKLAAEVVCRNVVENAFGPDEEGSFEVYILRRPGQIVVAIEDRGLPGDYARFESGGDSALQGMLRHSFADEAHFTNLGRGGNRVELVKHLPHEDIRDHPLKDEQQQVTQAPAASEDISPEIRIMRPEESPALSRSVYRSYGYSYDWEDIYYPDRIREFQESGLMRSCVAATPEGEFVGHLALRPEQPDSPVGEAGQAVVDPRFRGHQLFERMKTFLAEDSKARDMYGLYSEATAVHPYSQRGNLHLGSKETGFLLGYIPASVSYKDISEGGAERRGSVALFYMRVNEEPRREIYPPAPYDDAIQRVVEHNGLRRVVQEDSVGTNTLVEIAAHSQVSLSVRQDHNLAFLRVIEPGADLPELVRLRLRELCLHRIDCIYLDLPLSHPAIQDTGAPLAELGFFFGGIVPELRGGDVLRLQYLNNVEVERDDVHTASDFGEKLLDLIFAQRDELE
jgi:serine/threonine-protein kinase RsbW